MEQKNETPVSAELEDTFKQCLPDLEKKYGKPWHDYTIEKVWVASAHVNQTFYYMHVKMGEIPNHHHYTVKFEINHGKFQLHETQEGYKTIL